VTPHLLRLGATDPCFSLVMPLLNALSWALVTGMNQKHPANKDSMPRHLHM